MKYTSRFIHKISPRDTDTGAVVSLCKADVESAKLLAKALRSAGILAKGQRIAEFRREGQRLIVFPAASIWHSIALEPLPLPSYTSIGCYPIFYLDSNNEVLCAECAAVEMLDEHENGHVRWEGPAMQCDACGDDIESAYGDPDEEAPEEDDCDVNAVLAEIAIAGQDGREISHACARTIASLFHSGQGSLGYAFASTGVAKHCKPPHDSTSTWRDLFPNYGEMPETHRRIADWFGTYLLERGAAAPPANWATLWIR